MNKFPTILFIAAAGLSWLAGCGDGRDHGPKSQSTATIKTSDQPALDPNATPYPLKTCLVSGEELGKMGEPYRLTYKGQEVKLCCRGCEKDFHKEPEKFLQKIAAAAGK
jgi:hypothetical protein